MKGQPKFIVT